MEQILESVAGAEVQVFVVWEPMLATDWASPGAGVLARVTDRRAAQYWDKKHLVAGEMARAIAADPEHPRPRCCEDGGILWDLVAVYPRGGRWDVTLPRAAMVDGPVWQVSQLEEVVREHLEGVPAGGANGE